MQREFILFIVLVSSVFTSCSTPIPESRSISSPAKKKTVSVQTVKQFLPEGWADITSRSQQPQIKLWIIRHDYSATMVLRELQADSITLKALLTEEMNLLASISLHGKIPENDPDYRVTRVPSLIDVKRNIASYAYSEKGLLRRVVVFKKQNRLMELELMQEQSSAEFDALTNDLISLTTTVYDR